METIQSTSAFALSRFFAPLMMESAAASYPTPSAGKTTCAGYPSSTSFRNAGVNWMAMDVSRMARFLLGPVPLCVYV